MIKIETYKSAEFHNNQAVISGMPEQIGLTQEEVTAGLLSSKTSRQARDFVNNYLDHVRINIDTEHTADAKALTRKHLIDQLYYIHVSTELKPNHPANLKPHASRRLVVEAMVELLEDNGEIIVYDASDWAPDRAYGIMRDEVLARRGTRRHA